MPQGHERLPQRLRPWSLEFWERNRDPGASVGVFVTYAVSTPYQYGYRYLQAVQPGVRWETLTLNTRQLEEAGKPGGRDAPAPLMGSQLGRLNLSLADLRRRGHKPRIGWDEVGRLLLVNHNVEMMMPAIIEVNEQADVPDRLASPIPHAIRTAREVIAETFTKANPLGHADHWASALAATAPASALTEQDR